MTGDIQLGDPVIDLATGRALVVVEQAAVSVAEWQARNDYDLLNNYGNDRLGATANDSVWTCVYVASLQSEPSKTYDFPAARLGRPAYERARDEPARVYDVVARDVLERMLSAADGAMEPDHTNLVAEIARDAGLPQALVDEARELAAVEQQFGGANDAE